MLIQRMNDAVALSVRFRIGMASLLIALSIGLPACAPAPLS